MKAALLIGNGLNRCYANAVPWNKLLENIAQKYGVIFNENNPFPLEFESIANQIFNQDRRNAKTVYTELKSSIAQMVSNQTPSEGSLHELFAAHLPVDGILTTNYDYMLERALQQDHSLPTPKAQNISENKYSLYRFANYAGKLFYHIHGEANKPTSLCLGYEHYAGYLAKMREYLKAAPSIDQRISNVQLPEKPSWMNLFFTHDIYIVGLRLDTNEIDLWWLLTYRAYLYYSNDSQLKQIMKNRIKIFLTHDDPNQRELFHNLHVETELIEVHSKKDYEPAYRNIAQKIRSEIAMREMVG